MTSVWRRHIELPRYLRATESAEELGRTLDDVVAALGLRSPFIVSGKETSLNLAQELPIHTDDYSVQASTREEVARLECVGREARADSFVAVGGGKTIDVTKAAGLTLELPVIVIPTQLTNDGIGSPISVIAESTGEVRSLPARLPIAVLADLSTIERAPQETSRAGLGDLLANLSALVDWRLASRAVGEEVDDFAALLSEAAFEVVFQPDPTSLKRGPVGVAVLRRLLNGLVLSGLAMEIAGSSRPCSGSEHLISHALDRLAPGTAYHGEQVAFGALVATYLQGGDWRRVRGFMQTVGLSRALRGFDLDLAVLAEAVFAAPDTRPGRYTVLDEVDTSRSAIEPVLREVLEV